MKRLSLLFAIGSLSACALAPTRPTLFLCIVDYPRQEAICGSTDANLVAKADEAEVHSAISKAQDLQRYPLEKVDKATCLLPTEWEKLTNYADEMEQFIKLRCK